MAEQQHGSPADSGHGGTPFDLDLHPCVDLSGQRRGLQQSKAGGDTVVLVHTAEELQAAVAAGARDIEIRSHLDLTALAREPYPGSDASLPHLAGIHSLMYVASETRSIRGNCQQPPPVGPEDAAAPPRLPVKPRQCVVAVGDSMMRFLGGRQWLDSLHFRLRRTRVDPSLELLQLGRPDPRPLQDVLEQVATGQVYMTNVTIQGDRRRLARVLSAGEGSKVVAEDCEFADLHDDVAVFSLYFEGSANFIRSAFTRISSRVSVVSIQYGGLVRFEDCVFRSIQTTNGIWVGQGVTLLASDDSNDDYNYDPGYLLTYDYIFTSAADDDASQSLARREPAVDEALAAATAAAVSKDVARVPVGDPAAFQQRIGVPACPGDQVVAYEALYDASYGQFAVPRAENTDDLQAFADDFDDLDIDLLEIPEGPPPPSLPAWVPAVPFATPQDEWFVETRDTLPQHSAPGNASRPELAGSVPPPTDPTAAPDTAHAPLGAQHTPSGAPVNVCSFADGPALAAPNFTPFPPLSSGTGVFVATGGLTGEITGEDGLRWRGGALSAVVICTVLCAVLCAACAALTSRPRPERSCGAKGDADSEVAVDHSGGAAPKSIALADSGTVKGDAGEAPATDRTTAHTASTSTSAASHRHTPAAAFALSAMQAALDNEQPSTLTFLLPSSSTAGLTGVAAVSGAEPAQHAQHEHSGGRTALATTAGVSGVRRLRQKLDTFSPGDSFLGRFVMSGRAHRRSGGRVVVQLAEGRFDGRPYALRFFLDGAAFRAEAALLSACVDAVTDHAGPSGSAAHSRAGLPATQFLPQVAAVCPAGAAGLVDMLGRPLPPCIVMEHGDPLEDVMCRNALDKQAAPLVLLQLSECIANMHATGYVHRNLKPGNVLWLARERRWAAIDFGSAVCAGAAAPLAFTLTYAAPEVVAAFVAGAERMDAAAAQDAWALGVLAVEMLTGRPAFDVISDGPEEIVRMLTETCGARLPWEGAPGCELREQLGRFEGPVMQLLLRDPVDRCTARAFHDACAAMQFAPEAPSTPTR